ncbi:alpha/beta fold hydrolase [Neisseria leonii]|uniref:Alpha/beta fold hydrolase n=1 Tax=Neisseria leonii TaxID=2995413 RepID=A0A9X4E193_9NEIS|nr:alpha/beta fold hydrolase [Neisseria sp. 51.81]MDD9327652.1 alpha/beta fold hydrolase [Neisseria sp. 51.81]
MNTPEPIYIDGPTGRLETLCLPAQGRVQGVAVINHPNPLQGGTNTNKVIQTAAKVLAQTGFHCYLPNLRGAGGSDGVHDYGEGEAEDCLAVLNHACSRHPEAAKTVIAGFSFGGYVSLLAAEQHQPDLLLLIGAAANHYRDRRTPALPEAAKTLVIHGECDEVVTLKSILDWAGPQGIPVLVLPQASHFFHGKLIALRDTVARFAPAVLAGA